MKILFSLLLIIAWADGKHIRAQENGFSIEPYLLEVKKTSAIVAFHFKQSLNARVLLFDSNKIQTFKSNKRSKSHFIKIENLKPGRTYNYQVIGGKNIVRTPRGDTSYQIRTACKKGESFSFIVYGDPRPGETRTTKHHRQVIERVIQKDRKRSS